MTSDTDRLGKHRLVRVVDGVRTVFVEDVFAAEEEIC